MDMDYKHVQEYVDKYVKGLAPFRNNKTYQSVISLLQKDYLKHSYVDIPAPLKTFVEDQKISTELYDNLLLGVGYPKKLLTNLRFTQKKVLVESLMDYNRYVSTVQYVNKLCLAFKENFNIYELYGDFRLITDAKGKSIRDWVMVQRPLFEAKMNELEVLDYDEIYNDTPTYFVSKQHLESLRQRLSITLPFKTNLIMLDLQNQRQDDDISQLVATTALFYFKDYYFGLYLNNDYYDITIADAYRLYYYIIYRYIGEVNTPQIIGTTTLTYLNISGSTFPYSLDPDSPDSIVKVIDAYNNLPMSRTAISEFINTYITLPFKKPISSNQYTVSDFRKRIMAAIGDDIINSIDNIMDSADNKLYGAITALGLIEDSLRSYVYTANIPLLKEYEEDLFRMFNSLLVDPKLSATYQVLNFFKPFHTQLIAIARYYMSTKTRINNALLEDKSSFVVHEYPVSSLVASDEHYISYSVETGYFEFSNSDEISTDLAGASSFTISDKIYARDITTNIFPTDTAKTITNIYPGSGDQYIIKLESAFDGVIGVFPRAYKYYSTSLSMEIDLSESGGYFSFTNVGFANEVHTTIDGFFRFGIGDRIYGPEDTQDSAVEIISKDPNTFSFILRDNYTGTAGVWTKAYRWRPN